MDNISQTTLNNLVTQGLFPIIIGGSFVSWPTEVDELLSPEDLRKLTIYILAHCDESSQS